MKDLDDEIMEHGHVLKLTKEEFIKQDAEALGVTPEEWSRNWNVVECNCDYMYCQGWQVTPSWVKFEELEKRTHF